MSGIEYLAGRGIDHHAHFPCAVAQRGADAPGIHALAALHHRIDMARAQVAQEIGQRRAEQCGRVLGADDHIAIGVQRQAAWRVQASTCSTASTSGT